MWQTSRQTYVPSTHPSALACQPPDNGKPVAAIRGALKTHSRIITSSVIRIATGHCFDAHYSQRFRPGADDPSLPLFIHPPTLHTRHHILFQCPRFAKERRRFIPRPRRLQAILQSEVASEKLGLFLRQSNCSIYGLFPRPSLYVIFYIRSPHHLTQNPRNIALYPTDSYLPIFTFTNRTNINYLTKVPPPHHIYYSLMYLVYGL
jgi:hypothetical protein